MTVINGDRLLLASPIKDMLTTKVKEHGVSHGLAEVGYDIRVKQEVVFSPARYHITGSLTSGPRHRIDRKIADGNFCIASAIEEFIMPVNLVGIVHDKSTWARKGLSVFNTVIEPGWEGFLTLELVYHGNQELHIPAGAGIAQVVFHELAEQAAYVGKYQNQENRPVEAIHH